MEQTSKSLSFLLMASSKWMNKKWKRKQFTFSSSKLPTGEFFAYFAYLHFLVVIWSTLGGIGNAGFVVSRAFNLLQADNLLFCTAWESDPGFDNLNFHWVPIFWQTLGKNPILMGYVVLGIGYGVSAHDLSGYKVLGVLVVDNGPHVKEPLTALLKPIPKSWVNQRQRHTYAS